MRFIYKPEKVVSLLLTLFFCISFSLTFSNESFANTKNENLLGHLKAKISSIRKDLENKRMQTKAKIVELKKKEQVEVNKLYKSQATLETTKNDIQHCETKLYAAKNHLSNLQSNINELSYEQQKTAQQAGERIKQIYKGERVSILHLIFAAQDISTFLDRVYYQKRLSVYDKNLLHELRIKTRRLVSTKNSIEYEKNNILSTLNVMNNKKRQISAAINTSQYLINRLRTNRATYESAERQLARQSATLETKIKSSHNKSKIKTKVTTGFAKPLVGIITSPFGWRKHPIFGSKSFHTGVDIGARYGTPIKTSNSGKVIYAGWYGGYGKVVIVSHGNYRGKDTSTLYAHMSKIVVGVGSTVQKGKVIGYEGTTGYSTGPHLHFEVRLDGRPTNPLNYIP
ncbi:MAG: peptidoglycan DD-metalloendopeptidase family protein [Candidatus Gastranaerophilales bacterium]|nr:peptidoglycan DD-metalloendopeptidase family protein [Candidatus Gastranaerophilales bacterium]